MDIKTSDKEFVQKDYLSKLSEDERNLLTVELSLLLLDFQDDMRKQVLNNIFNK